MKEDPVAYNSDGSADEWTSPTNSSSKPVSTSAKDNTHRDLDKGIEPQVDHAPDHTGSYVGGSDSVLPSWGPDSETQEQDDYTVRKASSVNTPFSDKDESAIRGLLALGSNADGNDVPTGTEPPPPVPGFEHNTTLSPLLTGSSVEQREADSPAVSYPFFREMDIVTAPQQLSPRTVPFSPFPEARKVELLRHYLYHVAPWVSSA